MSQIADLRAVIRDLDARGDAALPEALPVLRRIGQMMETQVALHSRKEDDAFFPAIEAVIGAEGGPTAVMRAEHQDIHAQGELLRRTLHELKEVEHPGIVAGGERLRTLVNESGSASALRATAEELVQLLDAHFDKEEQILFPMARSLLDERTLSEVAAKMETLS
jgi:hemerythrin-like domain-containing protein